MTEAGERVVVVTGAASGIGRAVAQRLLAAGSRVMAVDLDGAGLDWAENATGARAFVGDVSSEDCNREMIEMTRREWGGLNTLVLNAGLAPVGGLEQLSLDDLDRGLGVNLKAVALGLREALPSLREAAAPSVVVTASISGLAGDPGMWAYNASKGGVINLVKSASLELARHGIRINAVCPGPVHTGMSDGLRNRRELYEEMAKRIPLGRWGEPEEVAGLIEFLASSQASYITGAAIPVDGGVMASTGQFPLRS